VCTAVATEAVAWRSHRVGCPTIGFRIFLRFVRNSDRPQFGSCLFLLRDLRAHGKAPISISVSGAHARSQFHAMQSSHRGTVVRQQHGDLSHCIDASLKPELTNTQYTSQPRARVSLREGVEPALRC
jgi:hypothetical protein